MLKGNKMKSYAHPLCDIPNEDIESNKVFPLLRELNYRYGLVVLNGYCEPLQGTYPKNTRLYLVDEKGYFAGEIVWKDDSYTFRSVVTFKERGQGESRFEYYSAKLPSLMGTLKREHVVLTGEDLFSQNIKRKFLEAVGEFDETFGATQKKSELAGQHQHVLLQIVFNNRNIDSVPKESINYFKTALDTFNGIDMLIEKRRSEYKEIFANPITVACYDKTQTYMVGKVRIHPEWNDIDGRQLNSDKSLVTVVEPFKRTKNILEDTPELRHRLAVFKSFVEQNSRWNDRFKFTDHMFPVPTSNRNMYIEETGVVVVSSDKWHSHTTDSSKSEWAIFL
mgnify:FL=1